MARLTVLLVEDSPLAQTIGKLLLEKSQCTVEVVSTGEQALIKCQKKHYDIILMDIGLPGIDGISTAKKIRETEDPQLPTVIIALTAHEDLTLKANALQAGISDYLIKPPDLGIDSLFFSNKS